MQITLRLSEFGKEELERLKSRLGFKKNAPAVEHLVLGYRSLMDECLDRQRRILELEQENSELSGLIAIISYLESK